jgi:MATE family multidrug resistance protein
MALTPKTFSLLLRLAIPMALTGLLESSVFFFETLFLAHLGSEVMAAGALVSWLFGTCDAILFGLLTSINILVAHKHGACDKLGISTVVRDGIRLAIVLAIPSSLLFWNMSPIFLLFGQSPEVVKLAEAYLHALVWGIFPNFILIALLEVIIGLGYAKMVLLSSIFSVSFTILFSIALIFGKFGFPALGIAGAGWGITISAWLTVVFLGVCIFRDQKYKKYFSQLLSSSQQSYLFELFKIGMPMGLMYCTEVAFFFVLSVFMGSLGASFLAANQVALQFMGTFMAVIFSIAQAITVRMGHLLGARDTDGAKNAAYAGIVISALLTLSIGIVYWLFPSFLIGLDFDVKDIKHETIFLLATQFLGVCAFFQFFEGIRISLFGALRGLKDTHFTLLISVVSFWGIAFPCGYWFSKGLGYGGVGLWWGMVVGAFFSVGLLFWRFHMQIHNYKPAKS